MHIRALKTFVERAKQGSAYDKVSVMNFPRFSSVSSLVNLLLHPCVSGETMYYLSSKHNLYSIVETVLRQELLPSTDMDSYNSAQYSLEEDITPG